VKYRVLSIDRVSYRLVVIRQWSDVRALLAQCRFAFVFTIVVNRITDDSDFNFNAIWHKYSHRWNYVLCATVCVCSVHRSVYMYALISTKFTLLNIRYVSEKIVPALTWSRISGLVLDHDVITSAILDYVGYNPLVLGK